MDRSIEDLAVPFGEMIQASGDDNTVRPLAIMEDRSATGLATNPRDVTQQFRVACPRIELPLLDVLEMSDR
jgi:hypothetical protein